jgi:DNA-3-methyladenine glycosylase
MEKRLSRSFYERNPELVARDLLGKVFVRRVDNKILKGKIVETEAYLATGDEAAHNFKGKNKRNQSLYKAAGHAYVHSMRQYFLLDVVTENIDVPSSVLIRAVEPIEGIDYMKKIRGTEIIQDLANGPSKFCISFGIDKQLDGIDTTVPNAPFYICDSGSNIQDLEVAISGRIGISRAKDVPLRFWIKSSTYASRKG